MGKSPSVAFGVCGVHSNEFRRRWDDKIVINDQIS